MLTRQISFESVYCVTFQRRKPQLWTNFDILEGLLYPAPFTDEAQIWYASADSMFPSPAKLGMMIEDLENVLVSPKIWGFRRIVSPLWDAENSQKTLTQLQTLVTL